MALTQHRASGTVSEQRLLLSLHFYDNVSNISPMLNQENHRMVWAGRDLKHHLVPTPCHGQGHLPQDQGAQSPVQPGLEHFS